MEYNMQGNHPGFETQDRHHQKKQGISGPTKRTYVLQNYKKKKISLLYLIQYNIDGNIADGLNFVMCEHTLMPWRKTEDNWFRFVMSVLTLTSVVDDLNVPFIFVLLFRDVHMVGGVVQIVALSEPLVAALLCRPPHVNHSRH